MPTSIRTPPWRPWCGCFWRQGVASTGVQDVVTVTGLNRSSRYATFGGK